MHNLKNVFSFFTKKIDIKISIFTYLFPFAFTHPIFITITSQLPTEHTFLAPSIFE